MLNIHKMNFYINMCKFILSYNLEWKIILLNISIKKSMYHSCHCADLLSKITFVCVKSVKVLYTNHMISILDDYSVFFLYADVLDNCTEIGCEE